MLHQNVAWLHKQDFQKENLNDDLLSSEMMLRLTDWTMKLFKKERLGSWQNSKRRETNSRNAIEQRLTQLRHELQDAMTEHATSFTRVS